MKNLNSKKMEEILKDFALTVDEMICVKGGDMGDPIVLPTVPPVKI